MAEALVRHDELIADCVESRGGRFLKLIGESTVSVFDSVPDALAAAVAATRALSAERWPKDLLSSRFVSAFIPARRNAGEPSTSGRQ